MPEEVRAALERFQSFAGTFDSGVVIRETSGFTNADAQLLICKIEMAAHAQSMEENPLD